MASGDGLPTLPLMSFDYAQDEREPHAPLVVSRVEPYGRGDGYVIYWPPPTVVEEDGMTEKTIDDVFKLLDDWRHLPKYQLERRADIYFALFLPEVLQKHCDLKAEPSIIPEFPLRKSTLGMESKGAESKNADYAAYSKADERVFLVELKTEMKSRRDEQDEYLEKAARIELSEILKGVKSILPRTKPETRGKYLQLLKTLKALELIEMPSELEAELEELIGQPTPHKGLTALVKRVKVTCDALTPEIVYILPEHSDIARKHTVITFKQFADIVTKRGPIGERFAGSLSEWEKHPAGK